MDGSETRVEAAWYPGEREVTPGQVDGQCIDAAGPGSPILQTRRLTSGNSSLDGFLAYQGRATQHLTVADYRLNHHHRPGRWALWAITLSYRPLGHPHQSEQTHPHPHPPLRRGFPQTRNHTSTPPTLRQLDEGAPLSDSLHAEPSNEAAFAHGWLLARGDIALLPRASPCTTCSRVTSLLIWAMTLPAASQGPPPSPGKRRLVKPV